MANIELNELEQRALERFVQQEARKQENIETITAHAAASLAQDAKVEELDEDWVAHFFKQCDTVSDKEMQLWARLLSGEASAPGTFSKRTVDFVSTIDKKDAALFTTFCQFVWMIGDATPLIYDTNAEIYTKNGITFDVLSHLDAIGLLSFQAIGGYSKTRIPKQGRAFYYGRPTLIEFPEDENNTLQVGDVLLTRVGKELAPISGSQKNDDFYKYIIQRWFNEELVLSSPARQSA